MEVISKTFSKSPFQTALWKEQLPASFVEHPADRFLSAESQEIVLSANGNYQ